MSNQIKGNKISKTLSYILRHGALKYNIDIDKYGYIKIDDISIFSCLISLLLSNLNSLSFRPPRLIPPKLILCNLNNLILSLLNILLISLFLPCLRTSLT